MTSPALPFIECEQIHAGLAASDIPNAVEFYTKKLGFQLAFTWGEPPTFAGVNLGRVQMFLAKGTPTPSPETGAVYFLVGDADQLYEFHRSNGVEIAQAIADRPYGIRDYTVRDLHGYYLVFGHHLFNAGPPIKIERVDVPVRLEKRLAALLQDLAKHKRMSVDGCLEEMLLHTNEGVGPHTKTTLHYIQELKRKHGIDYDSHASYRFVEDSIDLTIMKGCTYQDQFPTGEVVLFLRHGASQGKNRRSRIGRGDARDFRLAGVSKGEDNVVAHCFRCGSAFGRLPSLIIGLAMAANWPQGPHGLIRHSCSPRAFLALFQRLRKTSCT